MVLSRFLLLERSSKALGVLLLVGLALVRREELASFRPERGLLLRLRNIRSLKLLGIGLSHWSLLVFGEQHGLAEVVPSGLFTAILTEQGGLQVVRILLSPLCLVRTHSLAVAEVRQGAERRLLRIMLRVFPKVLGSRCLSHR